MKKTYKLIKKLPFENTPEIGYISTPHCTQKDNSHYLRGLWFDPSKFPEFWEEVVEKNNNPNNLEVGKTYKVKYQYCESEPIIVKITRITQHGFPWSDDAHGIITDAWEVIGEVVEKD
ncbi:MAG: hypothetical protein WD512_04940 [Candidatus Paceibacterota bacterium]